MDPDGRTEWTDGRTDDAKTISLQLRRGITTGVLQRMIIMHWGVMDTVFHSGDAWDSMP